jgi:transposase InsO family protein
MSTKKQERIAIFRYGVIASLVGVKKNGNRETGRLIRQITSQEWAIPGSPRSYISRSVVMDWLKRYEESDGDLTSLYPKVRIDKGRLRSMDQETEQAILKLKKELGANVTLPVFLKIARERNVLPSEFGVSLQTLYRLFTRHGLDEGRSDGVDRRKFEAELPNDLWQADIMHGPLIVDGKSNKRKAFLFAIIDDHSRLIVNAGFYLNERVENFLDCFKKAAAKRGLPRKLYLDNGPAFRSHQLRLCLASLGVELIHCKAYVPQGKGKIERWFRTCRLRFLPLLKNNLTLEGLNGKLEEWLQSDYQFKIHDSTSQSPTERFVNKLELIRRAPGNLNDYFRTKIPRQVANDRTVRLCGKFYEAPAELTGKLVTLCVDVQKEGAIEVFYKEQSYGLLTRQDKHSNSKVRRDNYNIGDKPKDVKDPELPDAEPPKSGQLF